jgi:hypothetical protein
MVFCCCGASAAPWFARPPRAGLPLPEFRSSGARVGSAHEWSEGNQLKANQGTAAERRGTRRQPIARPAIARGSSVARQFLRLKAISGFWLYGSSLPSEVGFAEGARLVNTDLDRMSPEQIAV